MSYLFFKLPGKKRAIKSMIKTHFNFWGLKKEIFEPIVAQLKDITAPTLIF
jgi:hypothetical protein